MLVILPTLLEQELIYPLPRRIVGVPRHAYSPINSEAEADGSSYRHSTGSAGLIQTIQQYVKHSWAAAVLGTIALTGWVIQGLGNAVYYRQVGAETGPLSKMLISG